MRTGMHRESRLCVPQLQLQVSERDVAQIETANVTATAIAIAYSICRDTASSYDDRDRERDRESPNCELSDRDSRELDIHDPGSFDASNYDFYERSIGRSDGECMDGNHTEDLLYFN